MHEYATVTAIWKDVLECLNEMSEKVQTAVRNVFGGYHLSSLNVFFKELGKDLNKNQWNMKQKQ